MKRGFDSNKYYKLQSKTIKERFKLFDKLYLEVGGKLLMIIMLQEFFLDLKQTLR